MRIIIKEKGKRGIRLWFPTRMIFSNTAARILSRKTRKAARGADERGKNGLGDLIREAMEGEDWNFVDEEAFDGHPFSGGNFWANVPEDKMKEAMRLLRRMKIDHPGVPLVDVESSDGERVLIHL